MIVNKRIAKYSKIIQILNIASFAVSVLVIISQGIDRAVNGIWSMWKDLNVGILNENLISLYIVGILCSPFVLVLSALFSSRLLIRIDSLRIYECVKLCENVNSNKIRIKLTVGDYLLMCIPVIFDICGSFLFAMFNSVFFTNGYFAIIFGRYLGSFVGAHLFSYVTIIFYAMCCKEKKKELLK